MTDIALADAPGVRDLIPTDRQLLPAPMAALQEVANMLAGAGALVPKDLRGKPDVCLAVAYMAALHGTDPVATASQTYLVGDKIAFMAQYINAIVQRHLAEKPVYNYQGQGATRAVMISAKLKSGQVITYTSPQVGQIKVKNSPLWVTDPDQQLAYYAVRAMSRRHMPDVLLGIYAVEELQNISIRDVTPLPPADLDAGLPVDDLEHVEATEEGETFEPSGGFPGDASEPVQGPAVNPVPDDLMEFAAILKADAKAADTPDDLVTMWRMNRPGREALKAQDPTVYADLEQAFIDRQKELSTT